MIRHNYLWLVFALCATKYVLGVTIPPRITAQSQKDIYYKDGETVKMVCEASGSPKPEFFWERAGAEFNPAGNDDRIVIKTKDGEGTIIINSPEDKDEGLYQCFAKNDFGVAATVKYNLREAKLGIFKATKARVHNVRLGDHLKLDCQSPDSVPDGETYWVRKINGQYLPVFWNQRVTLDLEDRMHFTHIIASDHTGEASDKNASPFHCAVYNSIMRLDVYGPPHYIITTGNTELTPGMRLGFPPSDYSRYALVGENVKLKCIFYGNPTPIVHWYRSNNSVMPVNADWSKSFGQELQIYNIQPKDGGVYSCEATQEKAKTPLSKAFYLTVKSPPTWVQKPRNAEVGEGDTATFKCLAKGNPPPKIEWHINGKKIEDAMKADKKYIGRLKHTQQDTLIMQSVTKSDTFTVQCNVTNQNGYLWGEAYLNVLAEAPTILIKPEALKKVAEGQPILITCLVKGRPIPTVTWYKNGVQTTGGRFVVMVEGHLYIEKAMLSDAGDYLCNAKNSLGEESSQGRVVVRRPTIIEQRPRDIEVKRNVNAKFTCSGTTDPEEIHNLETIWFKDYKQLQVNGSRLFKNIQDSSLTISGAEVRDSGTYTCVVRNGLDNDTASARLVVTDIPDPCTKVSINNTCHKNIAEVVWSPGSFNNAPIQYFTVEYTTSLDPNHWVFAQKVNQTKSKAFIPLSKGMDYKFRVMSVNKRGQSRPSKPSVKQCKTQDAIPSEDPKNIQTIGDHAGKLHIEWTPVPPERRNGEKCYYEIKVTRVGDLASKPTTFVTKNCSEYEVDIDQAGASYERYIIEIQTHNIAGSTSGKGTTFIGRGYESMPSPTIAPSDLAVVEVKPDRATFSWTFSRAEITRVDTKLYGKFNGFKIQTWQTKHKSQTLREYDLPAEDYLNGTGDQFTGTIKNMLPETDMMAQISVMNNFYVSRPSIAIPFKTKPGLPGPVYEMFDDTIGDTHIYLNWVSPLDDRGDLIGYDIGYQEVRGLTLGEMREREPQIDDPYATKASLSGLHPNTKYRIHIWARTAQGRGESYFIERTTSHPHRPVLPRFTVGSVGSNYINVTWYRDPQNRNSGFVIFVEYMKEDGAEWLSTAQEVAKDWATVGMLEPGTTYWIRIVTTNGNERRESEIEDVTTDGDAKAYDVVSNLGWFIAMIFSLILHIALIVLFVVCYRRGFRFKPLGREKEVRTYRNGEHTYTDETSFRCVSKDLGPEPRGYHNEYYGGESADEREYDTYYDKENEANDRRYPDDDVPYDEYDDGRGYYQDGRGYEDERDYGGRYNYDHGAAGYPEEDSRYTREPTAGGHSVHYNKEGHEYEEYGYDPSDLPPPPSDLESDAGQHRADERYDRRAQNNDYDHRDDVRGSRDNLRRNRDLRGQETERHHSHNHNDPNHDHERCKSVVEEVTRRLSEEVITLEGGARGRDRGAHGSQSSNSTTV